MKKMFALFPLLVVACGVLHAADEAVFLRGVVTHQWPNEAYFFMHTASNGDWRVSQDSKLRRQVFAPGDLVEVEGVLETEKNRHTTRLFDARVRKTGHDESALPPFAPVGIAELYAHPEGSPLPSPDWYAHRLVVEGKVIDLWRKDYFLSLMIRDGGDIIFCHIHTKADVHPPEYFGIGARVAVRGIGVYQTERDDNGNLVRISNVSVHAASMEAMTVLSRPPWWTAGRVAAVATAIGLALVIVIAIIQNRRRIERIAAEATARERLRLSADLHDDFQQLLASSQFSLGAAMMALELDKNREDVLENLKKVEASLQHTQTGLRAALWAMNEESEGPSRFSGLVRYAASRLAHWKGRVHFSFSGKEPLVARHKAGALLMILQEAASNAMRHGGATRVDVACRFGERDMEMLVADNGDGFDVNAPSSGMGLNSMRQRVSALGGTFAIESSPGKGTTMIVRFPI